MPERARRPDGTFDPTLRGSSLEGWQEWLESEKAREWGLKSALALNGAAVKVFMPLWMLATLLRVPLSLLSIVTVGLLFWPFHWLIVRPITAGAVVSSALWANVPLLRPVLLLVNPIASATAMTLVSLIPDGNPDHLTGRLILFELWPLTERRLTWIAAHGHGGEALPAASPAQ